MASLRKRNNGKYSAIFYDPTRTPKRKWVPLGTSDEQAARAALTELERDQRYGEYCPWEDRLLRNGVTLSAAAKEYLRVKSREVVQGTLKNYIYVLRRLEQGFSHDPKLTEVRTADIDTIVFDADLALTTKNKKLQELKSFFRWCVRKKYLKHDPTKGIEPVKGVRAKRMLFLSESQVAELVAAIRGADVLAKGWREKRYVVGDWERGAHDWFADLVVVAVGTGMRRAELVNLRWASVDLEHGLVHVENKYGFRSKSGKDRAIPIAGEVHDLLKTLHARSSGDPMEYVLKNVRGEQISLWAPSKYYRTYAKHLGFPEETVLHTLRHTFASWLVMGGLDLYKLKELLGHASIQMTERYAHLQPGAGRDEMEEVFHSISESGRTAAPRRRAAQRSRRAQHIRNTNSQGVAGSCKSRICRRRRNRQNR